MADPVPSQSSSRFEHWITSAPTRPAAEIPTVVTDAVEAERCRGLGWTVEGPFVLAGEVERLREALTGIQARCDRIVAGEFGGLEAALEMSNEARRALRTGEETP